MSNLLKIQRNAKDQNVVKIVFPSGPKLQDVKNYYKAPIIKTFGIGSRHDYRTKKWYIKLKEIIY